MVQTANKSQPQLPANPALRQLEILVGEWQMESPLFPGQRGLVRFDWLEGGAFVVEHMGVERMDADAIWIVGRDESIATYCMLYSDARGVSRIYEMALDGASWKIWRNAPGFSQRFTATLSENGGTITGVWEKSGDGSTWEHDFDVTYTRIR